ncbi:unnamed protein product [Blumeria hordei]|uniref:rRNA biogenesis protein RRP5 n=1 Tax=Blumeria hordei TaxID=2867405 RepID=A0A383V0Q8_BLUHO|nr:unnamed protein product [Blumeria hordei]
MAPEAKVPMKRKRVKDDAEESKFPRGGASILTPLEYKQIQIQATKDALFEQQETTSRTQVESEGTDTKRRKSGGKSKSNAKKSLPSEAEKSHLKIEGLNFKRLVAGSLVFGQVHEINEHDIALSLPNNLTGYVPITSISDQFTQRVECSAILSEEEFVNEKQVDDISLKKIFKIGQYLRAYVVSTSEEARPNATSKPKRRIELSLLPQLTNNLIPHDILVHSSIMASVISVEDHGVIMDLGLEDKSIKGFISSNELDYGSDPSNIQEGAIYLCFVTGLSSNGKIIKLSADSKRMGNLKKSNFITEVSNIQALRPGTAVEILVTDITAWGIAGKFMGMVDASADLMHSGAGSNTKVLEKKYKIGSKVKGRIIYIIPNTGTLKLGISFLDHIISLTPKLSSKSTGNQDPISILPLSTILEKVTVKKVETNVGLLLDVGVDGFLGFAHISRISDSKIETLSEVTGPYKLDSTHRARIIGYSPMDGIYIVTLQPSVIDQPFLRIDDLVVGSLIKGKIEKLIIKEEGVVGLLVKLAEGVVGLVPQAHMSDIKLQHPEKKFKEGQTVNIQVLSTDSRKKQIRLTMKKSLINSDAPQFLDYGEIQPGMQSPGTIINILPSGAVVQFYGNIRGFLPVAEMSETYIQDPSLYFQVGQVVNVHVLNINPDEEKMTISCKDPSSFSIEQKSALEKLEIGELVSAIVLAKSDQEIQVTIQETGLRALLPVNQLSDGPQSRISYVLKKIRIGATLNDLVVLEKDMTKRLVIVTIKPNIVKDAKNHTLIRSFNDVKPNIISHGFVRNITPIGIHVQFGGRLTGLLPKGKIPENLRDLPDFGMKKFDTIKVKVINIDQVKQRFSLSMIDADSEAPSSQQLATSDQAFGVALNPVDTSINSISDITVGKCTKAKITSVKETQINVQLADNVQGRIDVSQIFDSWDSITDRKRPLKSFSAKQILDVRVLGTHDARNHCFLPITHRGGKTSVFELSAKPSDQESTPSEPITLDNIKVGSSWIAYVNNIIENCLWVNLTPNIRGRIAALEISEDISLLNDLQSNFPVGSALRVHVTNLEISTGRLDLSARSKAGSTLTYKDISKGMIIPGKVTKVEKSHIMVQISDAIVGQIQLTDLSDNFSETDLKKYSKNDIIRVCVCDIDEPNRKIRLSARPSRVLNSSLTVQDPDISSIAQLKVGDVVRGFVKNITEKGIFVSIGWNIVAYVRVTDLSDSYFKDWKCQFELNQLVRGKILSINSIQNQVQISLKSSVIDEGHVPTNSIENLRSGQIVTGKIRKVEDYGVFIVVDGSNNVSGLCHKSELADKRVHDVKKLYSEGDSVKAIILKLDLEKRRVNFGLKTSYFEHDESDVESEDVSDLTGGLVALNNIVSEEDISSDEKAVAMNTNLQDEIDIAEPQINDGTTTIQNRDYDIALSAGGFNWSGNISDQDDNTFDDVVELSDGVKKSNKKRKKAQASTDRTGDLDANEPQSVSDFERLLLGQPDSSSLWIQYMAFQVQLGELNKAREVAQRAIKSINLREETERLNIWIALLNLENVYGCNETVEKVFKDACQYNDAQAVHERLISIFIQSEKNDKADDLFQALVKKFSQMPSVWYNYAHFLYNKLLSPERARAVLLRATQSLPPHTHLNLTMKFAALEFHSPSGSPERGRTIFEGLLSTFPKRLDIWNQILDLEIQHGDPEIIRALFERFIKSKSLKPKGAKAWFKKWSEWEKACGDKKSFEKVQAKAEEWVRSANLKKISDEG